MLNHLPAIVLFEIAILFTSLAWGLGFLPPLAVVKRFPRRPYYRQFPSRVVFTIVAVSCFRQLPCVAQDHPSQHQMLPSVGSALGEDYVQGQLNLYIRIAAHADPARRFPAILLIHGGAFQSGSQDDGNMDALESTLYPAGFSIFSVRYRLAPGVDLHQMVRDIQQSVRFLRYSATKFNIDPTKIYLVGDEAGGYLATMAALQNGTQSHPSLYSWDTTSDRVQGVVVLAGVGQFGLGALDTLNRRSTNLDCRFQNPPTCDQVLAESLLGADPVSFVRTGAPPFVFLSGSDSTSDHTVPIGRLRSALLAAGGRATEFTTQPQAPSLTTPLWELSLMQWLRTEAFARP